ncbi:MAG: arsenate reductase (azurin) small subunit [Myxococcales bacterium]|nr:arsenate reductase (azurin) small subunit [Myxococcales bacterium]
MASETDTSAGGGEKPPTCLTRRDFLLSGSGAATTIMLASLPGFARAQEPLALRVAAYPRKRLGRISRLQLNQPVEFHYPYEHAHCRSFIVKLGVPAGAGVGPEQDVVAFNALCTHQGGLLSGMYLQEGAFRLAGPCPIHLSTFDLTRHGLIVAGHATQSLPQVLLETDGDAVYATGMMGLVYGFSSNLPRDWKEGG